MMVLSFQANARVTGRIKRGKDFMLGKVGSLDPVAQVETKQSKLMSATSLPCEFDLEVPSVCAGPDVRSGLYLLHAYLRFTSLELGAIWIVMRIWYSPFQAESRIFFVLCDSKSGG